MVAFLLENAVSGECFLQVTDFWQSIPLRTILGKLGEIYYTYLQDVIHRIGEKSVSETHNFMIRWYIQTTWINGTKTIMKIRDWVSKFKFKKRDHVIKGLVHLKVIILKRISTWSVIERITNQ